MHIILVEDDAQLGAALLRALERLGYAVTWLRDGPAALAALRDHAPDLMLLDLGLPRKDGLDVLREARRTHVHTPILVITARDELGDRVEGLDAGADDYLVKPFHVDELAARIRSLSRRVRGHADNRLEAGALCIDLGASQAWLRGDPVELTRREFSLLQNLLEHAGRVVRRESLEAAVYGLDREVSGNALEVLVHGLRRKLGADAIRTVRGFGYMVPRELA